MYNRGLCFSLKTICFAALFFVPALAAVYCRLECSGWLSRFRERRRRADVEHYQDRQVEAHEECGEDVTFRLRETLGLGGKKTN